MTSTCSQSAPLCRTSAHDAASIAKSAESIEGEMIAGSPAAAWMAMRGMTQPCCGRGLQRIVLKNYCCEVADTLTCLAS